MNKKILLFSFLLFCLSGCTSFFPRNQSKNANTSQNASKVKSSLFSSFFQNDFDSEQNEPLEKATTEQENTYSQKRRNSVLSIPNSAIQEDLNSLNLIHIEGNTWRTNSHPALVFGIMARILSQNYIISSADRKNFNLQTDWDKFFIDGRLFRNRISIMVFPVGPKQTEVVIKNAVEYFTGGQSNGPEENTAWLPTPDLTDEVNKLVEYTNRQTSLVHSQYFLKNR